MKPIQSAFKAAARLANEWRDSISYIGLTSVVGELIHRGNWKLALSTLAVSVTCREISRGMAWGSFPPKHLVGDNASPIDHKKNARAAAFVAGIAASSIAPVCLFAAGVLYIDLRSKGARLRDIPALYFDKETGMWDWPRRNNGGGTTQTQKVKELKDALADFGKSLIPGRKLVPVPVRNPPQDRPPPQRYEKMAL